MTTDALQVVSVDPVRVLIADDQALFRSGLARLLADDPRVEVVGQAANGAEAVAKASEVRPDVVLMDLKMPTVDGVEATRRILAADPTIKVLVLTTFEADTYVLQALRAGASGYVLKNSEVASLVSSMLAVRAGDQVLTGSVARTVMEMLSGDAAPKDYYDGLTARELEILELIASGSANKQIAYRLGISEKTVRNHVSNLYEKLSITERSQAVLYAVRKGLVDP